METVWKDHAFRVQGDFEDAEMPHKIDELLQVTSLPTNINTISHSSDDSEAPPPTLSL
jgi:hypothetical protein